MKENIQIGLLVFIAATVSYLAFFKNTSDADMHNQTPSSEVIASESLK